MNKNKTVKEKVEEIIVRGLDLIEELGQGKSGLKAMVDTIDKLYSKEMKKIATVDNEYIMGTLSKALSLLSDEQKLVLETWMSIKYGNSSSTCCNIEVSEPKGSEVLCPECKEWVTTK